MTTETEDKWHDRVMIELGACILELLFEHADDDAMTEEGLLAALRHPEQHEATRVAAKIGALPPFDDWEFERSLQGCVDCGQVEIDANGVYRQILV